MKPKILKRIVVENADYLYEVAWRKWSEFAIRINLLEENLERWDVVASLHSKAGNLHPVLGRYFWRIIEVVTVCFVLWALMYGFVWKAPIRFPHNSLVSIEQGAHLDEVARTFEDRGIVTSELWLKFFVLLRGGERNVIAGDYYFPRKVGSFELSRMITHGEFGLSQIRVVIFEGLNSREIAETLAAQMPRFDKNKFIEAAKGYEGFLFPDTYFLLPNQSPENIVLQMRENFARQVQPLIDDLEKFGRPLDEVIIMASIVEGEARQIDTKRVVAGILWKRLRMDMPLQADATFKYWNGKNSFNLTQDDLNDKNNPYNTYANKGLPPTPISNPGLDSIRAAIAPTNTEYLYFLTGHNGAMYYAVDFEGHKRNRELYLD